MRARIGLVVAAGLLLTGCASAEPERGPSGSPAALPSAPAVVTFDVADQGTFSVELVTNEQIAHVAGLQAGGEEGRIPSGTIVRDGDGGVNAPYSWHIDPDTLEFVDFTTEVCDGLPEYVEDGTLTSDIYCPWSATVVDLQPLD